MGIDAFHVLIYGLILFIERFNYYLILPIDLATVIDLCDNLNSEKQLKYV